MNVFLGILAVIVFVLLVMVTAAYPAKSLYTRAELKRRIARGATDSIELDRYTAYSGLMTLLALKQGVLLVLLGFLLVGLFGWLNGVLLAILVAVVYPVIARMRGVQLLGGKLYRSTESWVLPAVLRFKKTIVFFRAPSLQLKSPVRRVYSTEDLADVIKHSEDVIGANERALLSSGMVFFDTKISKVMTPRTSIKTIKHTEFLGPLVLDELHTLGHSRLPVINTDLDHIVGVLHLRELLSLGSKQSVTAEKAMEKVHYINQDDTLEHALAGFMKNRHHFYIVIDNEHRTVGILTLEDTITTLIGRKLGSNHIDL